MKLAIILSSMLSILGACATGGGGGGGGGVSGNDKGSEPANSKEAVDYQNAVNRCYRTGGTRVVKIMGDLRCY